MPILPQLSALFFVVEVVAIAIGELVLRGRVADRGERDGGYETAIDGLVEMGPDGGGGPVGIPGDEAAVGV